MLYGFADTAGEFETLGCYLQLCLDPNSVYILNCRPELNYARIQSKPGLQTVNLCVLLNLKYRGFLSLLQDHNRYCRSKVARDRAKCLGHPNVGNTVSKVR
jgi:hypothetical protein